MTRRSLPLVITTVVVIAAVGVVLAVLGANDKPAGQGATEPTGRDVVVGDKRGQEPRRQSDAQMLKGVEPAARRFLAGYLRLIYGRPGARPDDLQNANANLIRSLKANPGRIPPAQAIRRPRIVSVSSVLQGPRAAQVTAAIKDSSGSPYPLIFYLDQQPSGGRWLVTRLGDD